MSVTFVCGIPCSGKTTFIEKFYNGVKKLDIRDYQQRQKFCNVASLLVAQEDAMNDLSKIALQEDVVMEHTLLLRKRRLEQIKHLRENGYTGEINLYFIFPDKEKFVANFIKRNDSSVEIAESFLKRHMETLELPDETEGFDKMFIIKEW